MLDFIILVIAFLVYMLLVVAASLPPYGTFFVIVLLAAFAVVAYRIYGFVRTAPPGIGRPPPRPPKPTPRHLDEGPIRYVHAPHDRS